MSSHYFTRRRLLAGTGGAAALLATGGLSACTTTEKKPSNVASANSAATLPTYIRYKGVEPDLPGTEDGVDPAFRKFPSERPRSVPEKPGKGETLTGMANIFYAVPPGPAKNSYWKGLNERMGVTLDLQMVSSADYDQKFATTIAGNDLPDMMQMKVVANFPALLERRFTNLDEHLAGDAIKNYPNLANLPSSAWKSSIYNGSIYGIPIPRGVMGDAVLIRQDLFEAVGASMEPKGYEEVIEMGKALTDAKKRRWAYATMNTLGPSYLVARMNGEPNVWREQDGKFTNTYETDEYKQTLTDLVAIWKSGVVHPDAFNEAQPFKQLFNAGRVAINGGGYLGWTQFILDSANNPEFKLGLMPVHTRDGKDLAQWAYGAGVYSITALSKQDDPEKIKLILRVLDYLAAPFGTEEYLYRLYGEAGVDHDIDKDGEPALTKSGTVNTTIPIRYLADSPTVLYQPGRPQDVDTQYDYQSLVLPNGMTNPAVGLYSNTLATKGGTINGKFTDGVNQIIQGRKPFSEVEELIKLWRSEGGDEMRHEYEGQLAQENAQ